MPYGFEEQKLKPPFPYRVRGLRKTSFRHWSVSVTHRFLRRRKRTKNGFLLAKCLPSIFAKHQALSLIAPPGGGESILLKRLAVGVRQIRLFARPG